MTLEDFFLFLNLTHLQMKTTIYIIGIFIIIVSSALWGALCGLVIHSTLSMIPAIIGGFCIGYFGYHSIKYIADKYS